MITLNCRDPAHCEIMCCGGEWVPLAVGHNCMAIGRCMRLLHGDMQFGVNRVPRYNASTNLTRAPCYICLGNCQVTVV